jgi:hypothetical protein
MAKKNKQDRQRKVVKKRLEQERKNPKRSKAYVMALAICGLLSLLLAGREILVGKDASMMTGLCLLMGIASLIFAHRLYEDDAKRTRKIEELEREQCELLTRWDDKK